MNDQNDAGKGESVIRAIVEKWVAVCFSVFVIYSMATFSIQEMKPEAMVLFRYSLYCIGALAAILVLILKRYSTSKKRISAQLNKESKAKTAIRSAAACPLMAGALLSV